MPNDLAMVPSRQCLFIDANIFIYHFTQSPLTTACTAFLQRVEAGDLQGVTSVVTLAEVTHRLMILEAIRTFGFPSRTAVQKLKATPVLVQQLSEYRFAVEKIPAFNVRVNLSRLPPSISPTSSRLAMGSSPTMPCLWLRCRL